jgi:hypothetical protein
MICQQLQLSGSTLRRNKTGSGYILVGFIYVLGCIACCICLPVYPDVLARSIDIQERYRRGTEKVQKR